MTKKKKINFRKFPYRGIYTEMAQEQNCTVQNIRQAIYQIGNPRILEIFQQKKIQREENYKSIQVVDN
jgi:hypothetical protein